MNALIWTLVAAFPVNDPGPVPAREPLVAAPAIRLWLSSSAQYREGERARVQVESRDDGYLVVLNYDTDGRLRVLFPIDPRDDNFVRGGRRYEVRGRGERESFLVGREGDGVVYAAVSPDPFRFDEYEATGNWDYSRFFIDRETADPEAEITALLERMSTDRGFDYDLMSYRVWGYREHRVTSMWYPRPYGFYDDYWCDWWYRPSLFGCRSYWPGSYWGGYWGFGYGYYPYRSTYYGSSWWWRDSWYRNRPGYYPNYRWPVVVGRPRGYTVVRRPYGSSRPERPGSFGGGSFGGANRPSVIDNRPRGYEGRARPSTGDRPTVTRPAPERGNPPETPRARPRGRRTDPPAGAVETRPYVERDRGSRDRGPVMTDDRARSVREGVRGRPSALPEGPRNSDVGRSTGRSRPSYEPRYQPRNDAPRAQAPRNDAPRYQPRTDRPRGDAPRPRAEAPPRRDAPAAAPRSQPARGSNPRPSPPARASGPSRSRPGRP